MYHSNFSQALEILFSRVHFQTGMCSAFQQLLCFVAYIASREKLIQWFVESHERLTFGKEYPPYNGWFNNRANPSWGSVDSTLTRRLPPHYEDGVYAPSGRSRPNPRKISQTVMSGPSGLSSVDNKTALFVFFGAHVLLEISDVERSGCPPEHFDISVPANDTTFDPQNVGTIKMPYERSRYNAGNSGYSPNHPRDQLNEATSFLDGSSIYGNNKVWSDQLRLRKTSCGGRTTTSHMFASQSDPTNCKGELASLNDEGRFPSFNSIGLPLYNPVTSRDYKVKSAKRFYQIGSRLGNENPFLLSIAIMWFRHHNWLARDIRDRNPNWTDEQVFNEARVKNIATYQNIVIYDWVPKLLGNCSTKTTGLFQDIPAYTGYSPSTPVGITDVFQGAAMHYIKTLMPSGVYRRGKYNSTSGTCTFRNTSTVTADTTDNAGKQGLRVCNTYWNSNEALQETDIDELLMGMSSQIAEKEDHVITSDLHDAYYGSLGFSRKDWVASVIQKGRDHGLPDYNTAREEFGFPARLNFSDINSVLFANTSSTNGNLLADLKNLYENDISKVDLWTGGLLETTNGNPGELFCSVIRDQFIRLRNGDRHWFENSKQSVVNNVTEILQTTLRDVILRTNPTINASVDIQNDPFLRKVIDNVLCDQPKQLVESDMESCTPLYTHDYFDSSRVSYAVTFAAIGIFLLLTILLMYQLGVMKMKTLQHMKKRLVTNKRRTLKEDKSQSTSIATEIRGETDIQQVQIIFGPGTFLRTRSAKHGKSLRKIKLTQDMKLVVSNHGERNTMYLRGATESYDLVLQFADYEDLQTFTGSLSTFMREKQVAFKVDYVTDHYITSTANTKEKRDKLLQSFYRVALAQALKMERGEDEVSGLAESSELVNLTLNKEEFAQYFQLKPDSMFVEQMFSVADVDEDDRVTFREFLDIMVLFTKGSPKDKASLMFRMYDLDKNGTLSVEEFEMMLKSMLDMTNATVDPDHLDLLVKQMMQKYGTKEFLTEADFQALMGNYSSDINQAAAEANAGDAVSASESESGQRQSQGAVSRAAKHRRTKFDRARASSMKYQNNGGPIPQRRVTVREPKVHLHTHSKKQNKLDEWFVAAIKFNGYYRNHIFCVTFYTLITLGVFGLAFNTVASNNASGLKGIGGYAMATARASAAALMFNFSTLLLTMSRNTITFLRETFLHRYIPFDSAVTMHRIVAWMAVFFTIIHIIAHGINFYSISTQSASDLLCLFSDLWYPSDYLPNFAFWCFQTITGITGIILTLNIIIMYVFASQYARRLIFNWFQWTHKIGFTLLYFFMVLHGSGTLISMPQFYYYFLPFGILYVIDRLYSTSRRKSEISVVRAELLPSNVLNLVFKRPVNFDYKAGQWVRIACLAQSRTEYHPFTLSSAPHEEHLSLHIRAVGPWTTNLRNIYNPDVLRETPYPKLYLDGPFGEGHQDWYKFDVAVLVGGGIGVTPFASILKDLVNKTQAGTGVRCQAVYFMWITRDQKQYEWLTDIIRDVEAKDTKMVLNTHIFITQLPHKFDLRTTMLYICEKHFQKIAGKSLFTGLRAVTHFGRPEFVHFFNSLIEEHSEVKNFGVFSCGPAPMTISADKACAKLNKYEGATFAHHFENF